MRRQGAKPDRERERAWQKLEKYIVTQKYFDVKESFDIGFPLSSPQRVMGASLATEIQLLGLENDYKCGL